MRSLIPTKTSSRPSGWQTAGIVGAVGLAASLLFVQAKKRSAEQENPPQGKFVDVDGVRLHYLDQGEGPALVLLHGNGVYSTDFAVSGLTEQAALPYRVITFDRPGFGHSSRPEATSWTPEEQARLLYKALHQIGIEQPLLVGHSWGTLVALAMALDFPHYVRGMVLVSGYYYPSARPDVPLMSTPAIPVLGHLMRNTVSPLIGRLMWPGVIKTMFSPAPVPERFDQMPVWMALRPKQIGASASETALMIPAAARLSARYAELTLPIAVIAGEGDKVVSADHNAVRFHEEVQHSELIIEPGVGHMAHYADPHRIMEALTKLETSVDLNPGRATVTQSSSMH